MRDLDVIAIGSMMAEISPPRHSQRVTEASELVIVQAGSATTFALAFAKLGGSLGLISRVGRDEIGDWIRETLSSGGVDTTEIRAVDGQLTPVSLASVDDRGEKTFLYYRFPGFSEPLATLASHDIPDEYLSRASIFDLTESSLRSSGLRDVALDLAMRARKLGCQICFNPNFRPTAWTGGEAEAAEVLGGALAIADLAIMNCEEAMLITGESSVELAAKVVCSRGPDLALITSGTDPTLVVTPDGIDEVPIIPVDVQFDIGAGDMFHAAFLAHWRRGEDPVVSGRFAAHAAALKIQRPPTIDRLPGRAEVEASLFGNGD